MIYLNCKFQRNLAQGIAGVKGIQFCSNEGPWPFSRGDIKEIAKIQRIFLNLL